MIQYNTIYNTSRGHHLLISVLNFVKSIDWKMSSIVLSKHSL